MRIRDEEDLLCMVREFMRDNLNAKIDAINSQKTDFQIQNIPVDDEHFVFNKELVDLPKADYVVVDIAENIPSENQRNSASKNVPIDIYYAFEHQNRAGTYLASLRYMRAVRETILEIVDKFDELGSIELQTNFPFLSQIQRASRLYVLSGVQVILAIAN